jgi:hypothetical protein
MPDDNTEATRPRGFITGISNPSWWVEVAEGKTSLMFQLYHPDHGWLSFFFESDHAQPLGRALTKGAGVVREAAQSLPHSTATEN